MSPPAAPRKKPPPKSDALRANLEVTAVERVVIDPSHEILLEVAAPFAGIKNNLERLLQELNHPFRNWKLILPEFRGFALKNVGRYVGHPQGAEAISTFARIFLQTLSETDKEELHLAALEGLTALLEKTVAQLRPDQVEPWRPALLTIFSWLSALEEKQLLLLAQSYHPIKRIAALLLKKLATAPETAEGGADLAPVRDLAAETLAITYRFWLEESDPGLFARPDGKGFEHISHRALRNNLETVEALVEAPADVGALEALNRLPNYLEIVREYRQFSAQLDASGKRADPAAAEEQLEGRKLEFLFHIMEVEGLRLIHEETLREINRSLVHLVRLQQGFDEIEAFFLKTFMFLRENVKRYPHTALQCIEVLGAEIMKRNNFPLVEAFLEQAVRFGFQYAGVQGVGADWQPIFNSAHLFNIRSWLALIYQHPKWCQTLLSALVINLKFTGSCIRDTDLFQKEVTRLLNTDVAPIYNLVKQFAKELPVYFNEIGAEGELRDVSTDLDELTRRQDKLIHFLRKQCHVESSNLIVGFVERILHFWGTGETDGLEEHLPPEILDDLPMDGPFVTPMRALIDHLCEKEGCSNLEGFLAWPEEKAVGAIMATEAGDEMNRRRLMLMVRLHKLLVLKYDLGFSDIQGQLEEGRQAGFPHMEKTLAAFERGHPDDILDALLTALEGLKEIILSGETFEIREEIYQKRHIAVDIPSVYGRYSERKFDALSLSFRLENLANVYLEGLLENIREGLINRATFFRVVKYIKYYLRALAVDGLTARKLENYLAILERSLQINQFSFHQYRDIFRSFSEGINDVIRTYYSSLHRDNLGFIIPILPRDALLTKFSGLAEGDPEETLERLSETFMRDLIAGSFGLQPFDNFITRVQQILQKQQGRMASDELDLLLSYDSARLFSPLHKPNPHTRDAIHLGNKGFNLVQLAEQGLPVPPGVVLTTEYFRCQKVVHAYPPAREDFIYQMKRQIQTMEAETGKRFGAAENPLLVSVRSGALISMPGMMQTIHNVGINEEIVHGLIEQTRNPIFAWDNYRRFIQSWAMSFDVEREVFSRLMRKSKKKHGVILKRQFTAEQMEELAMEYKNAAMDHVILFPEEPWEQLLGSISQVINSWSANKALEYRRLLNISEDWGTAILIQSMIFGNVHQKAGTGVLFTAHPYRKLNRVVLWGDYTPGNQGEDIVGGLVGTRPISVEQAEYDRRSPATSLEVCFPEIYQQLRSFARRLVYENRWNPQEIEFTFDGPAADNLFLLQARDMVTSTQGTVSTFVKSPALEAASLSSGIGVSGGALCGLAVFNLDQIRALRNQAPKTPLILIRSDTVPDDIKEISLADGLLTARGGQTSHASIVAARLEKTCVVGCDALVIRENAQTCRVAEQVIGFGDRISIDGRTGLLLKGWHPIKSTSGVLMPD